MAEPAINKSIKGYDMLERVGSGGFGVVYRAYQATIGREVAVKVILPGFANNPEFIQRFEYEAQTIARLEHLHIVPMYDYWREPGNAYLVMRWMKGGSLADALKDGPLPLEDAATLLDQVTDALSLAHLNHVVHRDIKPSNILLDEEGNAYLADFGIARDLMTDLEEPPGPDSFWGTLGYLSPEQTRNEPVTARTDVFSLGVTLYELLTGEHPYRNLNGVERIFRMIEEPLPTIDSLAGDVRDEINEVIQRSTAIDPQDRFSNPQSMANAFRKAARLGQRDRIAKAQESLTLREQEILHLITEGHTNQQIADQLFIEHSTVKWHIRQIYSKLDVRSRRQAMRLARDIELLLPGTPATRMEEDEDPSTGSSASIAINPYKGLRAFETADNRHFFGREELIERLISRLDRPGGPRWGEQSNESGGHFLTIIGPSGSGKSSLMRAGLIPALWDQESVGEDGWFITSMTLGERPLDDLEVALLRLASTPSEDLRTHLDRDRYGLLRAAELILPDNRGQLVLLIDQFEELFLRVKDEESRLQFLELLTAAATDPQSRVRTVISLRADYYDRPLNYPQFGELVRSNLVTVLPLSAEQLERAIIKPAESVGVEYQEGLVTRIIDEVLYEPGALPLLQYALTELFDQRSGRQLTHDAYDAIGGSIGALTRRAEVLYREQDEVGQETIRQMFLRLADVEIGSDGGAHGFTRRRVLRSELASSTADDDLMDEIIDAYAHYRLLTLDHHPTSRRPTVEVAHEALLRKWARLGQWLDESREDVRQERAVSRAAQAWDEHDRDKSFLLRGKQLEQVEAWQANSTLSQSERVEQFLEASLEYRHEERQEQRAQRELEDRLRQRSRLFLRWLVAIFAIAALTSASLAILARNQRQAALDNAAEAQNVALVAGSRAALANHDTDKALALAWQAVALQPESALAQSQLSEAAYAPGTVHIFKGNEDVVSRLEISPDDRLVAAGSDDGAVMLWDLASGRLLWRHQVETTSDPPWVQDVAISADGRIVAATFDDRIMLWQAADGQLVRELDSSANRQKIAFDPRGGRFSTIGSEQAGQLITWDTSSWTPIREFDRGSEVEDIAYTSDGSNILLAGKSGQLTLVNSRTGDILYQTSGDVETGAGALREVSLSADGSQLVGAFSSSGLLIWDLTSGDLLHSFRYQGGIYAAAFNPESDTILTGGQSILRTIDPGRGDVLWSNTAHTSSVIDLAITSDGRQAVTTSLDETVRLWDLHAGQVVRKYAGAQADLFEVALSPDDKTALVGSTDGTVTLLDVETGQEIRRLVDDQPILAVTFSPNGRTALIGTGYPLARKVEPGHVILWDIETGDEIRRFDGQPYAVFDVEFSPDGRLAASSGSGAMAILWDVKNGQEIQRFDNRWVDSEWPIEAYWDIEFHPDGQKVYAAHADGSIVGWEVESGQQIQELIGHHEGAAGLAISADGRRLVSGGTDSQVILWDLDTGQSLLRISDHSGGVGQVRFSPDGTLLFGGGGDGTSSLWRADTGEAIRHYAGGFVFSPNFSPDGRHALVGYRNGAVELWRIDATLDQLISWIDSNRRIPELTCEQRELYNIKPDC